MICWRISESLVFVGENLWSVLRIVFPEGDVRLSADSPIKGKDKANMRKNISKDADFRME